MSSEISVILLGILTLVILSHGTWLRWRIDFFNTIIYGGIYNDSSIRS